MMEREFTHREKFLLIVLALVIVAGAYYLFVQLPVENQLAAAADEKADLELQAQALTVRCQRMDYMQQVIEEKKAQFAGGLPLVAPYDNFTGMMNQMNRIMADAVEYSLSFDEVSVDGSVVRRPIRMSFTAPSYDRAQIVLRNMEQGLYRCQISDLAIAGGESGLRGGVVSVSATVTYFETTEQ